MKKIYYVYQVRGSEDLFVEEFNTPNDAMWIQTVMAENEDKAKNAYTFKRRWMKKKEKTFIEQIKEDLDEFLKSFNL